MISTNLKSEQKTRGIDLSFEREEVWHCMQVISKRLIQEIFYFVSITVHSASSIISSNTIPPQSCLVSHWTIMLRRDPTTEDERDDLTSSLLLHDDVDDSSVDRRSSAWFGVG